MATLLGARDLTSRVYPFPKSSLFPEGGTSVSFHGGSHHQDDPVQVRRYATLNRYHVSTMAYLAEKLRSIPDGDGTLLDHSLIVYGSNMGNSNQHQHYDVAHLLVGGAGGKLKGNRHLAYARKTHAHRQPAPEPAGPVRDREGQAGRQHRPPPETGLTSMNLRRGRHRRPPAAGTLVPPRPRAAGRSDVADAAMNGDRQAVTRLLRQKADVNAPQVDGATALHWAVYRDDLELAGTLLTAKANVAAANRVGMTPLAMAALYGNPAMIDRLLKAGADAKALTPNGETMLMLAARNGNPQAVKLLVEAGADVNARERLRGTTALMWAASQRHPEAVKMLVAAGADVGAKSAGAGLPRNYMANRVNLRAVAASQERRRRAAAAGITYEEQLALDQKQGRDLGGQRGLAQALGPDGSAACGPRRCARRERDAAGRSPAPPAAAAAPAAAAPAGRGRGAGPASRGDAR